MNDFDNNKVEVDASVNPTGDVGVNKPKMVVKGDQSKYVKKKPSQKIQMNSNQATSPVNHQATPQP